jgi:hypothetical protein
MKYFLVILIVLGMLSFPLMAQDTPKAEVFGGYQYQHLGGDLTGINTNGWEASVTGNINKHFGVGGDFGGVYKSISGVSAHLYSYEFGPVIAYDFGGKINPFAHVLFGGFTIGGSGFGQSGSTNGFAMKFGGGVDVAVTKVVAVRLVQFDWDYYRTHGVTEDKNVSIATGIVFRF